jgi:membrane fusion protein (multidrug efflux system)
MWTTNKQALAGAVTRNALPAVAALLRQKRIFIMQINKVAKTVECAARNLRAVEPAAVETPVVEAQEPAQHPKRNWIKPLVIGTSVMALLGFAGMHGYNWYQYLASHQETDDAYITGHLHQVSTRVDGTIEKVLVDDNEHVKAGQLLVMLDPHDYQVKVDQMLANLEQAQRQAKAAQTSISFQDTTAQGQDTNARGTIDNAIANISRSQAAVREATANIAAARATLATRDAELDRAAIDYKRFEALEKEGAISTSQRDSAKRDYLVALGQRDAAREAISEANSRLQQATDSVNVGKAQLTQAEGQLQLAKASSLQTRVTENQFDTELASVARAKAALEEAKLNLSYTAIVAPTSGRIGKKNAEEGMRVEPGQPLMTVVSDDMWVVANYKETQLKNMREGQKVEIDIDSVPEHKFTGHLLSFSPGSGSSFAVLPSDNATGNFTKIVQRLPVKIMFDRDSVRGYEDRLAPGLSVTAKIDVVGKHLPAPQLAQAK